MGLCVERSAELVVGMLGILKAGAAYVPLDPAYPRERLAWMIADAGAPVLLTQERLRGAVPSEGVRCPHGGGRLGAGDVLKRRCRYPGPAR